MTKNKTIQIPLSVSDLDDLQAGEAFDWNFDGVAFHLFKSDGICDKCGEEVEELNEDDVCTNCIN